MAFEINGTQIIDDNGNLTITPTKLVARELLQFNDKTQAQGDISGYTSGGSGGANTIDKFPFASDANATDVGNLSQGRGLAAGQSSTTFGYTSGGTGPGVVSTIDKFPFASDVDATDVGVLTQARTGLTGQSSEVSGYASGGFVPPQVTTIDKFPFSTDINATAVGDLTQARDSSAGQSSSISGYTSGGYKTSTPSPTTLLTIDKFPFAADTNATLVGSLSQARQAVVGHSSSVSGYTSGGRLVNQSIINTVDKFPFATDSSASDVGDLTQSAERMAGQSAAINSSAYTAGGTNNPASFSFDTIARFHFSSDVGVSNVGILTVARPTAVGQQV